ncbi:unnamed protein product [Schistosoma curassoni]|uniref:Reverse transcriptase domain-containing protein n=1 Tax=Schistosoma curassoni TaxID=6186 RepID=A0A183KAP5_9TREM|nr:unnamed protein product [Schistosoma curassoni]
MVADNILKAAIIIRFDLYEFLRIHFGLRNAAQTFQRLISDVLQGLNFEQAYVDDCLIAGQESESHLQHLDLVSERLQNHGMAVDIQKHQIGSDSSGFFGHTSDAEGL